MLTALLAAVPAWFVAALLLWNWEFNIVARWIIIIVISMSVFAGLLTLRRQVVRPLQSLANMLEALREHDYSLRGRNIDPADAVGEVVLEVNSLSRMLHSQRLEALEAGVLLRKVIADIDIAVFAFDSQLRLRLINRAGEALLGRNREDLVGNAAAEIGLEAMLDQPQGRIVSHAFPGGAGRWEVRRRTFREGGRPHQLLVISELSHALREEERQAWRRLVRVMGHELNSSLTPIKSIAGTLRKLIDRHLLPGDWRDDARAGLEIIHDRAESLERFMSAYARLARLPLPTRRLIDVVPIIRRVASLHGERVTIEAGDEIKAEMDADQIEQVLINVIKNAVEATSDVGGVRVRWRVTNGKIYVEVEDDGPGLAPTDNLWVPFFTTKPGGTGIGLALSREIVENHGGSISLENRATARGCVACINLPVN